MVMDLNIMCQGFLWIIAEKLHSPLSTHSGGGCAKMLLILALGSCTHWATMITVAKILKPNNV